MTTTPKYFVSQDLYKHNFDGFMQRCKELGFENNASRKSMRLNWIKSQYGAYWAFVKDNNIISISGCHKFPDMDDTYRIGYRSVSLPGEDPFKGFSRYGYNAIPNRILFQYQIRFAQQKGAKHFILTTNSNSDGHMYMSHMMQVRINKLTNLSEYLGERKVFGVQQSLWKYNVEEYVKSLKMLKQEDYFILDELKW